MIMGIIGTFFIYNINRPNKIYLVSLGDGLATGMTAYNIEGYNYNDYIRDNLEQQNKLEQFINEFAKTNQTVENLITSIENNYGQEETNLTIQQALAKAKIVTIGIGMDELANASLKQTLSTKEKEDFKQDMEKLVKLVHNFTEGKIYLLGIYQAYNLKMEDIEEINTFLKSISGSDNIIYIDITDLSEHSEYFLLNDSYYLNYKGHKEIAKRIQNA